MRYFSDRRTEPGPGGQPGPGGDLGLQSGGPFDHAKTKALGVKPPTPSSRGRRASA